VVGYSKICVANSDGAKSIGCSMKTEYVVIQYKFKFKFNNTLSC